MSTDRLNENISAAARANIEEWLNNPALSRFQSEIERLIDQENWTELENAFFANIEFGTAGIRGRTGLGSARINDWTVGAAVQGLADYLRQLGPEAIGRGVVIGSDTRLTSPHFVELTAMILRANQLKVFRFAEPREVGAFSMAVRQFGAKAGIYISASHNPPSDNGLKIYWEDGGQVLPPHDKAITEAVRAVKAINGADKGTVEGDETTEKIIGAEFDALYRQTVLAESVYSGRQAKIVYSPFHGTGQWGVLPILKEAGFAVSTVNDQMEPDGNFPNVPGGVPNPQNRQSNQLTAEQVLAEKADLGISTDPDADRLGLVVPMEGETVILDGNQTAALLAYFIALRLQADNRLPANGFMARTIVTTAYIDAIAADFGLKCYNDLLVGFKYIGETIRLHADEGGERFIFAGEESFGCLKGDYARDKDAAVASLMAAEMVSWLKDEGRTVWQLMSELRQRYGTYHNQQTDFKFDGAAGFGQMSRLMAALRQSPPSTIGDRAVVSIIDRESGKISDPAGKSLGTVTGHTGNVLIFNLSADGRENIIVRPSGTEPKVKLYNATYTAGDNLPLAEKSAQQLTEAMAEMIKKITS